MKEKSFEIVKHIDSTKNNDKVYIEPEIVNRQQYQKSEFKFFFRTGKKKSKFILYLFFAFIIVSLLFIIAGLLLSTSLVGLIIGLPLALVGVVGVYIWVKIFKFFKDIIF